MSAEILNQTALTSAKRRERNLEYLTIGWNSLEAVAVIGAGLLSGSIALVGLRFRFGHREFIGRSIALATIRR